MPAPSGATAGQGAEDAIPLAVILAGLTRECMELAETSDALQGAIGRILAENDLVLDARTLRELQCADRMSQVLRGLSDLSDLINRRMAGTLTLAAHELSETVTLDSLKARLLSGPADRPGSASASDGGEMFSDPAD